MSFLQLRGLSKKFGAARAVESVSLDIDAGECVGILGPSGAGKSTLLRLIAGLERPDAGTVSLNGETLSSPERVVEPERRGIGMVFQGLGLWPHVNAQAHLDLVLRSRLRNRKERADEAGRLLSMARLHGKAHRRPDELSGGERQRLAFVRALAPQPRILLLDEPFAHVDPPLRDDLAEDLLQLIGASGITVVLVSHDGAHAASMCGRIAIVDSGRLCQIGTPGKVYASPASPAAARMTGPAFLLSATASNGVGKSEIGDVRLLDNAQSGKGQVCLRPESFCFGVESASAQARITRSAFIAGRWRTHFTIAEVEFWTWEESERPCGETIPVEIRPAVWIQS